MMKWLGIGMRVAAMVPGVIEAVEGLFRGGKKGQAKEDAAVAMVDMILKATEIGADRDLLDDEAVQDATREMMQAIVAFQNVVARKKAEIAAREAAEMAGMAVSPGDVDAAEELG